MGKHGVSGSDGSVDTDGSEPGRRRRTDGADALWGGGIPTPRDMTRSADDAGHRLPVRSVLAPEARAVRMPAGAGSAGAPGHASRGGETAGTGSLVMPGTSS